MSEILGVLGINTVNAVNYNTKFGINLNKRNPIMIDAGAPRLLTASNDNDLAVSDADAIRQIQTDFDLDLGDIDMAFIAYPDATPQVVYHAPAIISAANTSVKSATKVITRTYGVCELFLATEDAKTATADHSLNTLSATSFMIDFLQPELREALSTPYGASGDTLEWFGEWNSRLKVSVLRAPQHGKFVNINNDPNNQYLPEKGFIGKDRVDLLVEGKDDLGRSISLTLKYFINVIPNPEWEKATGSRYWKKYCGSKSGVWRISNAESNDTTITEQSSALSDLYTLATTNIMIANLPGTAIGSTTNETITLDTTAAGHGWHLDYTP